MANYLSKAARLGGRFDGCTRAFGTVGYRPPAQVHVLDLFIILRKPSGHWITLSYNGTGHDRVLRFEGSEDP